MSSVLETIELAVSRGPTALDHLMDTTTFPRVEGRSVTFVFRGEADEVTLHHWIHGLPNSLPFRRMRASDLFVLQVDLPAGSRMEYKIGLRKGPRSALIRDPLNPQTARDPFGANSVVHGEGYRPPDWSIEDPDARSGTIERIQVESAAFGDVRDVGVYLPARFRRSRRYPLLIAHDGDDYVSFASLRTVLDNLIHRLDMPPVIVALVQSKDRIHEFAGDNRHAAFLADELLVALEEAYPLVRQPSARGLLGASFGAVASLHAAWRRPGVFGKLMLQSGSFVFTDIGEHDAGPAFDPVVAWVNEFRKDPGKPAEQVFVSCGVYEGLIYYNRALLPLLQETGMQVRFQESNDGHNWENWRDRLRDGLAFLFPGPLWMVYE
jgi:enterochelin esterase-like enzyme